MNLSRCMMRRRVFIHELPAMRLVLPALVCSVGSRVVAMDASRFGMRCSFMRFPVMRPSDYLAAGRCSRAFTDDLWAQAGETASLSPDAHSQLL